MSVFSSTCRAYENLRASRITRHEIENSAIAKLIKATSRVFQILDRSDSVQAEISRKLWVLRSSTIFTFLPFDSTALDLQKQSKELVYASNGLPEAAPYLEILSNAVIEIVETGRNPKRDWLLSKLEELGDHDRCHMGIFSALSAGRPPGWPMKDLPDLAGMTNAPVLIGSRSDLNSHVFETIILPCACRNASTTLLSALFHSGRARNFEVLLYQGEKFQIPKRLTLPGDSVFEKRLQKTIIEIEQHEVTIETPASAVDVWVNEAFWQGLHGGSRTVSSDLVPANYVLFCDGTGTFLPDGGHVLILPSDGLIFDESDMRSVLVDDVNESDFIALRSGGSEFLLDEASERIITGSGDDSLIARATDWKEALEALLVTHSNEEVAQDLNKRGVRSSAGSIHQWTGPDVLGPGNERVFKELIGLLGEKGKIDKSGAELTTYAENRWNSLVELRSVRQKAGNKIRQDLFKALFDRFGKGSGHLSDQETIHLHGDNGAELKILRVASVDRTPAYVHPSRLLKLDELRGNKWLG